MYYGFHTDGAPCQNVNCALEHIQPENDQKHWDDMQKKIDAMTKKDSKLK